MMEWAAMGDLLNSLNCLQFHWRMSKNYYTWAVNTKPGFIFAFIERIKFLSELT